MRVDRSDSFKGIFHDQEQKSRRMNDSDERVTNTGINFPPAMTGNCSTLDAKTKEREIPWGEILKAHEKGKATTSLTSLEIDPSTGNLIGNEIVYGAEERNPSSSPRRSVISSRADSKSPASTRSTRSSSRKRGRSMRKVKSSRSQERDEKDVFLFDDVSVAKSVRSSKSDKSGKSSRSTKSNKSGRSGRSGKSSKSYQSGRSGKSNKSGKSDRTAKTQQSMRSSKGSIGSKRVVNQKRAKSPNDIWERKEEKLLNHFNDIMLCGEEDESLYEGGIEDEDRDRKRLPKKSRNANAERYLQNFSKMYDVSTSRMQARMSWPKSYIDTGFLFEQTSLLEKVISEEKTAIESQSYVDHPLLGNRSTLKTASIRKKEKVSSMNAFRLYGDDLQNTVEFKHDGTSKVLYKAAGDRGKNPLNKVPEELINCIERSIFQLYPEDTEKDGLDSAYSHAKKLALNELVVSKITDSVHPQPPQDTDRINQYLTLPMQVPANVVAPIDLKWEEEADAPQTICEEMLLCGLSDNIDANDPVDQDDFSLVEEDDYSLAESLVEEDDRWKIEKLIKLNSTHDFSDRVCKRTKDRDVGNISLRQPNCTEDIERNQRRAVAKILQRHKYWDAAASKPIKQEASTIRNIHEESQLITSSLSHRVLETREEDDSVGRLSPTVEVHLTLSAKHEVLAFENLHLSYFEQKSQAARTVRTSVTAQSDLHPEGKPAIQEKEVLSDQSLAVTCRTAERMQHFPLVNEQPNSFMKNAIRCDVERNNYKSKEVVTTLGPDAYQLCPPIPSTTTCEQGTEMDAESQEGSFRRYLEKKRAKRLYQNATVIQTAYRGCCRRKKYLCYLKRIIAVQHIYQQKRMAKEKKAIIILQSIFRGCSLRKSIVFKREKVIIIQKNFRKFRSRQSYLTALACITCLQNFQRQRTARKDFKKQRKLRCAIHIQSYFRGYLVRKQQDALNSKATMIEKEFRGYIKKRDLQKMRKLAVVVQKLWRAYAARQEYQSDLTSIVFIQSAFRRKKAVVVRVQKLKASIKLQSIIRCYLVEKKIAKLKQNAIVIQAKYRGFVLRQKYLYKLKKIIVVQSIYRLRKEQLKAHRLRLIIKVQSEFRRYVVQKRLLLTEKATSIQRICRGYTARQNYLHDLSNIVTLQSLCRGKKAIKEMQKIRLTLEIQSVIRGYLCRKKVKMLNEKALRIQTSFRRFAQRQSYQSDLSSIVVLQSIYRFEKAKKEAQKMRSIILVQSMIRGYVFRTRATALKKKATVIQKKFRGYMQRQSYQHALAMIVIMQSIYRLKKAKQEYGKLRAVILMQSIGRGHLLRRSLACKNEKATMIQMIFRGYTERQVYQFNLANIIILQSIYRLNKTKRDVQRVQSVIFLQSIIRGYFVRKADKMMDDKATLIQRVYRGSKQRQRYLHELSGIVILQSIFRKKKVKRETRKIRVRIVVLQSLIRGYLFRKRATDLNEKATVIQKVFRGYFLRKNVKTSNKKATLIQKSFRGYKQRQNFHSELKCIILLQGVFRLNKAARHIKKLRSIVTIQSVVRGHLKRKEVEKHDAIIIQKNYRGYTQRRKYLSCLIGIILFQMTYRQRIASREADQALNLIIRLQAIARSFLLRKRLSRIHEKAKIVQKHYRRHASEKFCKHRIKSITVLQNFYRAKVAVTKSKKINRFIVLTQSICRGHSLRKKLKALGYSAAVIQRIFRGYAARRNYLFQLNHIICIQRKYRIKNKTRIILNDMTDLAGADSAKIYNRRQDNSSVGESLCSKEKIYCDSDLKKIILIQSKQRQKLQKEKLERLKYDRLIRSIKLYGQVVQSATLIQSQWRLYKSKRNISYDSTNIF